MRVHYLGTCTSLAGYAAVTNNADRIAFLNARCVNKWPAPLLFNHQCDVAANGGCRIAAADGSPLFTEGTNQSTMTVRGKAIVIWSEAGGLLPFQF